MRPLVSIPPLAGICSATLLIHRLIYPLRSVGETTIVMTKLEDGERLIRRGDRIELENRMYKVRAVVRADDAGGVHGVGDVITLDAPVAVHRFGTSLKEASSSAAGQQAGLLTPAQPLPEPKSGGLGEPSGMGTGDGSVDARLARATGAAHAGSADQPTDGKPREKPVWVYVQQACTYHNTDAKSLLHNMGAHDLALSFLRLPFNQKDVIGEELNLRAVICGSYRLLKAMASHFALMQKALVPHVPTFLTHTEAHLVAYDISPTECISAIYKDNRIVCTQVGEDMVRHFAAMAAIEHAPRYLRFLGMLTLPSGQPARRCQTLVLQCLLEKEEAIRLYNGEEGVMRRDELIEMDDVVVNPRGELAYHIELIALFAKCVEGSPLIPVMQLRTIMPFPTLVNHLLQDHLPLSLKSSYLAIFDGLYLHSDKSDGTLQTEEVREELMMVMDAQLTAIDRFVEDVAPVAAFEDIDEIAEANFIFQAVLTTIRVRPPVLIPRHVAPRCSCLLGPLIRAVVGSRLFSAALFHQRLLPLELWGHHGRLLRAWRSNSVHPPAPLLTSRV